MYSQSSDPIPGLLRIPREIRLQILSYLLDDGGQSTLQVRTLPMTKTIQELGNTGRETRRTRYKALDGSIHRRCYETTYALHRPELPPIPQNQTASSTSDVLKDPDQTESADQQQQHRRQPFCPGGPARPYTPRMHPAILAACRLLHQEGSYLLYGQHDLDFGTDVAAVVPFMEDRSPLTRHLVRDIAVCKAAPGPCLGVGFGVVGGERHEWARFCRWLEQGGVRAGPVVPLDGADGSGPAAPPAATDAPSTRNRSRQYGGHVRRLRLSVEGSRVESPADTAAASTVFTETATPASSVTALTAPVPVQGETQVEGPSWPARRQPPQTMSLENLSFLVAARHEAVDWINDLVAALPAIEELEVHAKLRSVPNPTTTCSLVFAAFSASIETTLRAYLEAGMGH